MVIDEDQIPENVIKLLGEDGNKEEPKGGRVNTKLAERWEAILKGGLPKETLMELTLKYPPPENLMQVTAPKLNPEVNAAITQPMIARDKQMVQRQTQIGAAISALGNMLTNIIHENEYNAYIEPLSDTIRMLCDLHYRNSEVRRVLILPNLKKI